MAAAIRAILACVAATFVTIVTLPMVAAQN